jgi:outer membrane lipoprotein-sorting protein
MKKIFRLLLLASFISLSGSAQNEGDAQKILDQASLKLKNSKAVTASFSFTQRDKANRLLESAKGLLKIKGNKYYLKQDGSESFCNGIQTWNFDGENEVTVSKVDNNDVNDLTPQQLLLGFNKADFSFKTVSSAGTSYQIQLLPIDKRKNFKQLTVFVNKSTNLITKAKITDKTDNSTEIIFSNINLNASVPDTQFSFDVSKHPGVEVINQ